MNRITAATDNTGNYNVTGISYDKMGNIQSLTRNGYQGGSAFTDMDILDYDYDSGNKLLKVADTGNAAYGFIDGTNSNDDFEYDDNGNLEIDRNKGITGVTYNHLNLPLQVDFGSQNIKYVYDATGAKLKRTSSSGTETLYAGNFIYEGGIGIAELQFFSHPEGYVTPDGQGGYDYVYQYKDHLGNVRLSYTEDPSNLGTPTIIEESNYYPFGLKHRGYNSGGDTALGNDVAQKWKYQGQELTEDLGLNTYEFNFRMHDPAIGRFWQIDPLAEDYNYQSPYNFAENRVIDSRELEGLEAWQSTRNWTEDDIRAYGETVAQRAEEYRNNGTACTCEDFALNTLIDFASENELPIQITNGEGTFDSNSLDYDNVGDFRNDVLVTSGAPDLQNNANTSEVNLEDVQSGDVLLVRNGSGRATHVQSVSSVAGDKVNIAQGNSGALNVIPGASSILDAANPQSSSYTGVLPQTGDYNLSTGTYRRLTSTKTSADGSQTLRTYDKTKNAVNKFNLQARRFNFISFSLPAVKDK